jgi:hypothetical protein
MEKPLVLCRCGHLVMGKEVLRTDLYERSSGQEYVYVKFRCARCKRIAQSFVPASAWDWQKLEPAPGELSSEERDRLLEAEPVGAADLLLFHEDMAQIHTTAQLSDALRLQELAPPTFCINDCSGDHPRPRRRTRGRREREDKRASKDKKDKPECAGEAPHDSTQSAGDDSTR